MNRSSSYLSSAAGRLLASPVARTPITTTNNSLRLSSLSESLSSLTLSSSSSSTQSLLSSTLQQSLRSRSVSASAAFHTSSASNAKVSRYVKSLRRIQKHFARQLQKPKPEDVDPVLGRSNVPFIERMKAAVAQPENVSFGLTNEDTEKLIFGAEYATLLRSKGKVSPSPSLASSSTLSAPNTTFVAAAAAAAAATANTNANAETTTDGASGIAENTPLELERYPRSARQFDLGAMDNANRKEAIRRIMSMQNSGIAERKKLAVKFAVDEFGRFPGDTGSSEVQAAVWTIRIHYLVTHLKENKKDLKSMRELQQLVHNRQGILKYLRRSNPERYYWAVEKLGLNDQAVTAEFNLSRRYFEKYQFFGQNTLRVKDSKKERMKKIKYARLEKKAQRYITSSSSA